MAKILRQFAIGGIAIGVLYACGGGSSSTSSSITDSFPSGVTGGSPTSLVSSGATAVAQAPFFERLQNWAGALQLALKDRDAQLLGRALWAALPMTSAHAAPAKVPEGVAMSEFIDKVAAGTSTPTSANLDLNAFFGNYTSATCYGPSIGYTNHQDAGGGAGNGTLPGGDTGLWLAREGNQTTGTPCSAAQLTKLMDPVKRRMNATMIFGARMRALAAANGGMPAAGATLDLTSQVNAFFQTLLPAGATGTVTSANISNASGIYTYIVESSATSGANTLRVIVKVRHDGTTRSRFSGVASYATSSSAVACAGGTYVQAGTIRYAKTSDTEMKMSAREGPYCSAAAITSDFSTFAVLTADGELDPATSSFQDAVKGWQQQGTGFKRFGATYNPTTLAGDYKFAWQAGVGDSNSRMFAMNVAYNTTTSTRTGQAFFGFSGAMTDATAGATDLKGMICNWAGPGNSHTTNNYFQYQKIVLTETGTDWDFSSDAGSNKISYAPTTSCAITTGGPMRFDVDSDGTVGAAEGATATNAMDTLDAGRATVQATIEGRGFTNPSYY